MNEQELIERKEEIQARLKEFGLANKCVDIAVKLGEDRESKQRDCYTNLDYIYDKKGLKIDCNVGQNIQGYSQLFVEESGRVVFHISNSYPHNNREDLPMTTVRHIRHRVLVYEHGEWERRIDELAPY